MHPIISKEVKKFHSWFGCRHHLKWGNKTVKVYSWMLVLCSASDALVPYYFWLLCTYLVSVGPTHCFINETPGTPTNSAWHGPMWVSACLLLLSEKPTEETGRDLFNTWPSPHFGSLFHPFLWWCFDQDFWGQSPIAGSSIGSYRCRVYSKPSIYHVALFVFQLFLTTLYIIWIDNCSCIVFEGHKLNHKPQPVLWEG